MINEKKYKPQRVVQTNSQNATIDIRGGGVRSAFSTFSAFSGQVP